mmetsp:Transcript_10818/g.27094  ORF Transcript_10818/g.27094 Transcript_10818/m.27094 type:complete len:227 (+) Transcript_10818:471-1151(+)
MLLPWWHAHVAERRSRRVAQAAVAIRRRIRDLIVALIVRRRLQKDVRLMPQDTDIQSPCHHLGVALPDVVHHPSCRVNLRLRHAPHDVGKSEEGAVDREEDEGVEEPLVHLAADLSHEVDLQRVAKCSPISRQSSNRYTRLVMPEIVQHSSSQLKLSRLHINTRRHMPVVDIDDRGSRCIVGVPGPALYAPLPGRGIGDGRGIEQHPTSGLEERHLQTHLLALPSV